MNRPNKTIRESAEKNGVKLWEIAEQFGLTPAARSRITAGADLKDAAVDDMDALLGGG